MNEKKSLWWDCLESMKPGSIIIRIPSFRIRTTPYIRIGRQSCKDEMEQLCRLIIERSHDEESGTGD